VLGGRRAKLISSEKAYTQRQNVYFFSFSVLDPITLKLSKVFGAVLVGSGSGRLGPDPYPVSDLDPDPL
jgi:hypothetical protein